MIAVTGLGDSAWEGMMMKQFVFTALMLCIVGAASADAGEVTIGLDTWSGGTKPGSCHATTFSGPDDAMKAYKKRQEERFEEVDPAVLEKLAAGVHVAVEVVTHKQPSCGQNSGIPQRIIVTKRDSREKVLTIELEQESVELSNLAGAEFTAVNANGTVPIEDVRELMDEDYDFHLIYADHAFKDKWKKKYAKQILE